MTTPNVQRLSDTVCAAGQLDPAAMAWAAANGFKSVINNRPDFEHGPDQPTNASIAEAAQAAGLQYAFLPVAGGYQSPEEIAKFAELLDTLPGPILAFCRSGARVGKLFQAASALKE